MTNLLLLSNTVHFNPAHTTRTKEVVHYFFCYTHSHYPDNGSTNANQIRAGDLDRTHKPEVLTTCSTIIF